MPWTVVRRDGKYCVVKSDTMQVIPGGCHKTREEAEAHKRAMYANVKEEG